jgi:hypothetical protein
MWMVAYGDRPRMTPERKMAAQMRSCSSGVRTRSSSGVPRSLAAAVSLRFAASLSAFQRPVHTPAAAHCI